ncbi:hypothetical protein GCM10025877_19030 [Agromyces mangrovi Wang et al. 2018]|nr:hypothetical protein GCM10025877_19030 [Agromyces mangrovi]
MRVRVNAPTKRLSTVRVVRSLLRNALRVALVMTSAVLIARPLDDQAVGDGDAPIAAGGQVVVVGDDDEGDAALALQAEEDVLDLGAGRGVEVAGGLVGEDHIGVVDEGARDDDALLLAAREVGGLVLRLVGEPERLEHRQAAAGALARRQAGDEQRQGDVLEHGLLRGQEELLEHESEALVAQRVDPLGGRGRGILPVDLDDAGGRSVEQREQVHERRLARAGLADDGERFAAAHLEAHALQCVEPGLAGAVGLRQRVGAEHRRGAGGGCGGHRFPFIMCNLKCSDCNSDW